MPPSERRTRTFPEALAEADEQIRKAGAALDQRKPDIALAKQLIARCRSILATLGEHPPIATSGPGRRPKGEGVDAYAAIAKDGVTYLVERRIGHASDFLVPRALVDEIAKVVGRQKRPIGFREIEDALGDAAGQPAAWKIRVALRFLGDRTMVFRKSARYEFDKPATLNEQLEAAWRGLRDASQ